jgi:hypothetical protein
VVRPRPRPDRHTGEPAWFARIGAAALLRVARVVQRAAEVLAPAAYPAAAAPSTPVPPPRLPGQPPEHWLSLVREHAPELLLGRDWPVVPPDTAVYPQDSGAELAPPLPGHIDPLTVPPAKQTATAPDRVAPALSPAAHQIQHDGPDRRPVPVADDDRLGGRTPMSLNTGAEPVARAKPLARLGGAVWERLTGRIRTETPAVPISVHSEQTEVAVPRMRLTQPTVPEKFPSRIWVGPADRARPAMVSTAAEWPSLPAHVSEGAHGPARAAVQPMDQPPAGPKPQIDPWPALPDDAPLWTIPTTGYAADRLARLEREQAGG